MAERRSLGTDQEVVIACHMPVYTPQWSVTGRRSRPCQPGAELTPSHPSTNQSPQGHCTSPSVIGQPWRVIESTEDHDRTGSSQWIQGSTYRSWQPQSQLSSLGWKPLKSHPDSPASCHVPAEQRPFNMTQSIVDTGPNQTPPLCDEMDQRRPCSIDCFEPQLVCASVPCLTYLEEQTGALRPDQRRPSVPIGPRSVDCFEPQLVCASVPSLIDPEEQTCPLRPDHRVLDLGQTYTSCELFTLQPCRSEAFPQCLLVEKEIISKFDHDSQTSHRQHHVSGKEILLQRPSEEALQEHPCARKLSVQQYPIAGEVLICESRPQGPHTQVYLILC